jgi:UDP-GlcNAc:undecaprenyl-phosphate GlcNAc-1-phosphate transferase
MDWFDRIFTLFWIVGVMNSLNMLDNMDAVASVPALGILVFFAISSVNLDPSLFPLFLFLAGSVIAFLFFNWPPSKIFMGDSGSMVLGLVLAFGAIEFTWLAGFNHTSVHWYDRAGLTLLVFTIPLADTLTVTINRLWHGISPAKGGKDHTTHNFVYSGVPGKLVPLLLSLVVIIQVIVWWWFSSPQHYEMMGLELPPRVGRALASHSFPPGWVGFLFFLCYFILVFTLSRVNLSKGKYIYIK